MAGSRPQLARLLALIPFLQARPGITVAETARAFGVAPDQVRKDLGVLWLCGLPGQGGGDLIDVDMDAVDARGVIHLSNADYLSRPLRLTSDEAFAVVLALTYLRQLVDSATAGIVDAALAKVRAAMPDSATVIAAANVAAGSTPVRDAVATALREGRRLRLSYDGARGTSAPEVDPARVDEVRGVAYLQAWSLERSAWRTYRMERITTAEVLDAPAEAHGPTPPAPEDWGSVLPFTSVVTLRVPASQRWVAEYYPTRRLARTADGWEIELGVVDERWLRTLLLRLGADASVLPAESADGARAAARAALAGYEALQEAER